MSFLPCQTQTEAGTTHGELHSCRYWNYGQWRGEYREHISKTLQELIIGILWKLFCCHLSFSYLIMQLICTCQGSSAAATCAKIVIRSGKYYSYRNNIYVNCIWVIKLLNHLWNAFLEYAELCGTQSDKYFIFVFFNRDCALAQGSDFEWQGDNLYSSAVVKTSID